MNEVLCCYSWDRSKSIQRKKWLDKYHQRYLICLIDSIDDLNHVFLHPRFRAIDISKIDSFDALFKEIVADFLFFPFIFENQDHPLIQKWARIYTELNFRAFDAADQGATLFKNFQSHLQRPLKLFQNLRNAFQNIPAIICGGSPSLKNHVTELNRLSDTAFIWGCGSGVEALLHHKIDPHVAVHVDPASAHRFTPASIPVLYQLRTSHQVVDCYSGTQILIPGPGNFPLEKYFQEQIGIGCFDGGWTVVTWGVFLASFLGCNPIYLVGVDFGIISTEAYAKGIQVNIDKKAFFSIKNRKGNTILTRYDWVFAAEWLDQFSQRNPRFQILTTSAEGLEISSVALGSLKDIEISSGITCLIQEKFRKLSSFDQSSLWNEFEQSLYRCEEFSSKILKMIEASYPKDIQLTGEYLVQEHDLSQEIACLHFLDPLWNYWRPSLMKHISQEIDSLSVCLNRLLFFQKVCETLYGTKQPIS